MYIDALAEAGVRAEFARPIAEEIATATVMGSGALAMNSSEHPIALMNAVCSPGGTTIEGVCKLRELGFDTAVQQALQAITDAPASTVVAASRPVIADETIKNGRPLVARIFAVCYCRDDAAKPTTSVGNAMPATASGTIPPAYRHAATHLPLHKGANGCVNVPLKK